MKSHCYEWFATRRPLPTTGIGKSLRRFGVLLLTGLALATGRARAQQRPGPGFFQADAAARTAAAASPLAATLSHSQALTLDEPGLRAALATAPLEGQSGAAPLVLALPRPDGSTARFALREAPVMEPALAARYPQIKTYAGVGLDDATATVRLDLTPLGFHAQVLGGTGPGFDIAPASPTDPRHCLSYYRKDERPAAGPAPICTFRATAAQEQATAAQVAAWRAAGGTPARGAGAGGPTSRATGAQLRSYRLALSCIPEYAAAVGNTLASVQAVQATFVNQLNGMFERELAVRFVLVANNDRLIFLSGGPPPPFPFVNNFPASGGQAENQLNTDQLIGNANYDLGLLMTMNGGGGAYLGIVCQTGYKAQCSLGFFVPTSTVFVAGLAHELGHQFGAQHSFNNCFGQSAANASWEPGSGVTVMGYGGTNTCLSDEFQSYAESVFHSGSHDQIQAYMSRQSCGTLTATGNTPPVVSVPASGKTLPASTPFRLTAAATDANGDPLTYSWEQMDLGPFGPINAPQVTGETPPLFRVWAPTTSGTRYFPRLNELVNNTTARGEVLPTVTRALTFRCTARDIHSGLVGVVGGITSSALVNLSVSAAAGPFVVTAPNAAGISWAGGSTQTVRWDVAGTTAAPVSCALVNLRLSLDGGLTYPLTLATGVPNNGSASISVPNAPTATARVMVEAADNYFFDISNANFAITPGPGPAITSFTPVRGPVGTVVTLTGTGFTGATAVRFNGTAAASFTVVSATSITATVAAGSTSGLISVTTPSGTGSSAAPFLVGSPPTITSFTPTSGPMGTTVRVIGTNFLGATQVQVNGTDATFNILSATEITLTLADNTGTGLLTVTTPFGTATSGSPFTVPVLPYVSGFAPQRGPVGTVVVLTGGNFTGTTRVMLSGQNVASFTVDSDNQITVTIPVGAVSGPFTVTTPAGSQFSFYPYFEVVPPPVLTSSNPTSGVVGTGVTLTGTSLSLVTSLTLNGVALPGFVVVSATTITFVVPAGATTGAVLGTATGGIGSSSVRFTVLPPNLGIVVTGITPAQGILGATIGLSGTGLSGATRVAFSGSSGNTVSSGNGSFTVNAAGTALTGLVVPVGATSGPLTVTTPVGTSAASGPVFTLCARPVAQAQNQRLPVVLSAAGTATLLPANVNTASTANCGVAAASTLRLAPNRFTTADIGPAVVASALRLNGNDQYVAIGGNATVPTGNSPYTIEAWIKPTSMGYGGIVGWGAYGGGNAVNALRLSADGLVNYWWGNDFGVTTGSLTGAWHHVAATCDGTTRTIYLDGVAIGSDQPGPHNVFYVGDLRIGSTNGGEYFDGLIDEVRVWNVARTAGQLSGAQGVRMLRYPAGLVAYYRFGEGSGLATADATGTAANAGTLAGGAGWATDAPALVNAVPVALTVTDASGYASTAPALVTVLPFGTPLPVELTSFTAQAAGPAVRLAWATATERNSQHFDIERSADGQRFEKAGQVPAQGTKTSPTNYTYLDSKLTNPPTHQSTTYYRLRQVDVDGTFSYSPVRAVAFGTKPSGLTLVPNPARDRASTLAGAEAGAAVTVFDALGRRVLAATADAAGAAVLRLPAELPQGVYLVRSGARAVRLAVE